MREIKFRGYAVGEMVGSQWMYGTGGHKVVYSDDFAERTGIKEEWFLFTESDWIKVVPESIGQYTGLKDKNGKEIYEGDIVHLTNVEGIDYNALIIFKDGGFCAIDGTEDEYSARRYGLNRFDLNVEVIGNIHDNPELLEEKQ